MKTILSLFVGIALFFALPIQTWAQQTTDVPKTKAIQFEFDILGFSQSGFGIVGGYISGKNRIDVDLLTNTLFTSFTNGAQDFEDIMTERRTVMSIVYYRYLKDNSRGFYYGGGLSYYEYIVEHDQLQEFVTDNAYKPGVYIGYDFFPFKNKRFFLDVWLGVRWHYEGEELLPFSNGQYYKIPDFDGPLGMIKFGWRFDTRK